jgi:organic radical activating enzyme
LSDFDRDGVARFEEIQCWVDYWKQHIQPGIVTLFGGEPLLHPRVKEIVFLIRNAWPHSKIRLITNGYLLDKFEPDFWHTIDQFEMQISIHRTDHEQKINQAIKKILSVKSQWKVSRPPAAYGEHRQLIFELPEIKIWKSYFKNFITPYKLENNKLEPFNSDPAKAHAICGSPSTPVLYKGKLYKCPPVANLIDVVGQNWNNYEPCANADQLAEFVADIGRPESVCGQCPDQHDQHVYDHMDPKNVYVKLKNFS